MYHHEEQYTPQYVPPRPAEYYDTDCGNKMSLAKSVENSTRRYAIVGSRCARFKERLGCAPAADYDIDHLHKKGVAANVRESKQKYAASFSRTSRWSKSHGRSDAPDKHYDTNTLHMRTLAKKVEEHPLTFANMRSKFSRFGPRPGVPVPLDVTYDTDVLEKASLHKAVEGSSRRYAVMSSKQDRLKARQAPASGELGPGAYDTPCLLDMRRDWTQRAHSSFASSVDRLKSYRDPTKNLGSTWTPEQDRKEWSSKGHKFSTAKITRPAYLPSAYEKVAKPKGQ